MLIQVVPVFDPFFVEERERFVGEGGRRKGTNGPASDMILSITSWACLTSGSLRGSERGVEVPVG